MFNNQFTFKGVTFGSLCSGSIPAIIGMLNNCDMRYAMIGDKIIGYKDEDITDAISYIKVWDLSGNELAIWWLLDEERRNLAADLIKACEESGCEGPNSGCVGWPWDEKYYGDAPHGILVHFMWNVFHKRITA